MRLVSDMYILKRAIYKVTGAKHKRPTYQDILCIFTFAKFNTLLVMKRKGMLRLCIIQD